MHLSLHRPFSSARPVSATPVGRYAPSPTGQLHLGNARTALLAWLQIRRLGGLFILRMEDLDPSRSIPAYARQIIDDLRWLGLDWDEGPDVGGPCGPYEQSRRQGFYDAVVARFQGEGRIFPCACSRKDLAELARAPHGLHEEGPPYPGICRKLSPEAWEAKLRKKGQCAYRFHVPAGILSFTDAVAGPVSQNVGETVGDFVVRRADGVTAYQLAVVVDDALMGVTHVLRGDDLLTSTPRQILLYQALGLPVPAYCHVPLVLGPDGARLSKRHGDTAIAALREQGISPQKVVGFLAATSGLLPLPEPVHLQELIPHFSEAKLPRQPFRICEGALADLGLSTKKNH
ncbi:tRNA glutamyl-Q(34) synthetase GluQRS [Heliobacterium gestii]|uniref:Glutamyl-Q tRNA(Asp) synthetase n=1 Tax=Heliomicrobium gestii TaxID=2699 RepID=A0A845LCK1_HELGE|nr:tRNA glutamyl-Q(34) synthetase GluQRS [Heliomicrobium gestii]MBM7866786.1 glutamyl-tRNA synthetase [Heliomicrobium gestii]MZP42215.1 tRNA glutamyl-Q(34) synthetase GluQRS [Heliomicrobium gestii]